MTPYQRGGTPEVIKGTAAATAGKWGLRTGVANHLTIFNDGTTNDLVVYFSEADATADKGVTVPATIGTPGNPRIAPLEVAELWLKASAATTAFTVLAAVRRG